jgi:hypothetical protein
MVLFEELTIQVESISQSKLEKAWNRMSKKPFPKVKMLRLSDDDFNNVIRQRRCLEDDIREVEEWGRVLSTKGTDACIFNGEEQHDSDYVILVRKNPYHSLEEIILHELAHIARGDL